jgi:hypothetical protein
LNLDDDRATVVCLGLNPQNPAVITVEPLAHLPKALGKIGPSNVYVDHPHSGSPIKVLTAAV